MTDTKGDIHKFFNKHLISVKNGKKHNNTFYMANMVFEETEIIGLPDSIASKYAKCYRIIKLRDVEHLDYVMKDIHVKYPDTVVLYLEGCYYMFFTKMDVVRIKLEYAGQHPDVVL